MNIRAQALNNSICITMARISPVYLSAYHVHGISKQLRGIIELTGTVANPDVQVFVNGLQITLGIRTTMDHVKI